MEKEATANQLSCLVIDDEHMAHQALIPVIEQIPWVKFEGSCYSVLEAIELITEKLPDLIFLDVRMQGMSGINLLQILRNHRPHVIMVSAFKEFAFEGFEHEVVDFLLKPVSVERLMRAVWRVRDLVFGKLAGLHPPLEAKPFTLTLDEIIVQTASLLNARDILWVKEGDKTHPVMLNDLYAVEGLKDYVKLFHKGGRIITHGNVSFMEAQLPASRFVRINRSHIVNKYAVKHIEGNSVYLINGCEFRIPQYKGRDAIMKKLTN